MTKANCKEVRRELDEMMLGEDYGARVSTHLRECNECKDFHEKQTRLRQIVGGLGTVPAPPDFDFKLRSRLANETAGESFHLSTLLAFGQRSAAIATAIVLLIGAIVFVRYLGTRNTSPTVAQKEEGKPKDTAPAPEPQPSRQVVGPEQNQTVASNPSVENKDVVVKRTTPNKPRSKQTLASVDYSNYMAPVINQQSSGDGETVFPVDASQQSLKVSLFDGRGNPKTISVPPVSFGSQRVVPTATSFAPKGVW